ncbi:MAG TPA: hypothetical protein PKD76_04290 [Solirubrobacterales bacterium]|nr:hypothetical protein [Solirubrobacterales bacterium]
MLIATVVNLTELWETVAAAFVSSLAVAIVASLGIWGSTKYVDFSQEGRGASAVLALGVGILGLLATIAIIAFGLHVMIAG